MFKNAHFILFGVLVFLFSNRLPAQAVLKFECNSLNAEIKHYKALESKHLKKIGSEWFTYYLEKEVIPGIWKSYKTKKGNQSHVSFENVPIGTYRVSFVQNSRTEKKKTLVHLNDSSENNILNRSPEESDVFISNIVSTYEKPTLYIEPEETNSGRLPVISLITDKGSIPLSCEVVLCQLSDDEKCIREINLGSIEDYNESIDLNKLFFESSSSQLTSGKYRVTVSADYPCEKQAKGAYEFHLNDVFENLTFYPNPAKNEIFLKWNHDIGNELNVSLFDLTGNELKKNTFSGKSSPSVLKLDNIIPGVYILRLAVKGTSYSTTKKLVVE